MNIWMTSDRKERDKRKQRKSKGEKKEESQIWLISFYSLLLDIFGYPQYFSSFSYDLGDETC